ncbi:DUF2931 family protein [Pedobacter sp. PAMC26386]|nr:DUF2931 family protein [Pedobacter sp. PAMC26386]
MKLNLFNLVNILIAAVLLFGIGYRLFEYKPWDRYDYEAVAFAPEDSPLYIKDSYFITIDGGREGISHEEVNYRNTYWGKDLVVINHSTQIKLPAKLVLDYVSYRDQKFYADTLNLPAEKIKSIFKHAAQNDGFRTLGHSKEEAKGLLFSIGIARKGSVLVLLRGNGFEEVVLKGVLKSHEPVKKEFIHQEQQLSKDTYFREVFREITDSVKTILDTGFDPKANYLDTPTHYLEKQLRKD